MSIRAIHGDCRDVLKTLPDASVHCVVTSPPYFGLRDYGTGQWTGGEAGCDHLESSVSRTTASMASSGLEGGKGNTHRSHSFGTECGHCGARRTDSQIGLEATPDAYVAELVAVFREVRRVLRSDGVCFINLGDSYGPGKQLQGIPWRVAFALQSDGWILRQDIIWSKLNPMPESVRDRCTKAHEYLFLLSKSPRYFWDAEAIREKVGEPIRMAASYRDGGIYTNNRSFQNSGDTSKITHGDGSPSLDGRNKRSVWEVATQPFSEAHFATFPPALIEPCILAGVPDKCCAACGAPWVRDVERGESDFARLGRLGAADFGRNDSVPGKFGQTRTANGTVPSLKAASKKHIGFSPSCACNAAMVSGTVLDPFGGAGTTGLVADRLGRNAILIELNEDYSGMARRRIHDDAPLFAEVLA